MMRRALLLTGLFWLLSGCAGMAPRLESPNVSLVNVQLLDATLFEQRYALTVRVQNPNSLPLSVSGLRYRLDVEGLKLAHSVSQSGLDLPAYGEQLLTVELVSGLPQILQLADKLRREGGDALRFAFTGDLGLTRYNFKMPFEYGGELGISGGRLQLK